MLSTTDAELRSIAGSFALEGILLSAATIKDCRLVLDGKANADDLIAKREQERHEAIA